MEKPLFMTLRLYLLLKHKLERSYLQSSVGSIGRDSIIYEGVRLIHCPAHICIGDNTRIYHGCVLAVGEQGYIELGDHTHLGVNVYLNAAAGRIMIGSHVAIAPLTQIYSYSNTFAAGKYVDECHLVADVTIEDDVLVGSGATVLPGVKIHQGAIVGAGAVVTEDVPPYHIIGGVPARKIGVRMTDTTLSGYQG
jgi:maltose O-acetyltransferase